MVLDSAILSDGRILSKYPTFYKYINAFPSVAREYLRFQILCLQTIGDFHTMAYICKGSKHVPTHAIVCYV